MSDWLVDAGNPLLTEAALARVGDPLRPDRLAWNAFRTLALWDSDIWVPRLLDVACGDGNPLAVLEWSGASVMPWASGLTLDESADVVLDGPEALVVVVATFGADPPLGDLRTQAMGALADTLGPGKQAGFVAVVPPGGGGGEPDRHEATALGARDHPRSAGFAATASGWMTWRDLGALAVDLAEEADDLRSEQVHRLVSDLQRQFPEVEV